ncbi:hypothetical protein J2T02_001291 [Chitinophaga terrae (ex Kim and Jung 2007)]|uniref:hypothetical protein n=1 Tax=Chitinophaga terrae (ex Kim and Jung 2007) TaxID=408074 RepID=UPI00278573D2|nr:hypothetical protein [Chitinophaga terrae (ex Kim and Jung 2007)]MDQ0106183.1 hypothetical protein [Chitinophaga terrae (ex Kim and Jung 2007)]
MKNLLPAIILFLFFSPRAWSQASHEKMNELAARLDSVSERLYQTSVYISANKDIFIAGEDLWFNAFVLNARDFSLTHTDNTLYLRLQHTQTDSTIWQEMYPIVNGIAAGHVYLPDTLAKGSYVLKAFTRNSFVAGQPYFYASCPIEIVNAASQIPAFKQPSSSPRTTDIQFNLFPEGGNLVAGFPNKVAFKAVNKAGNPVEVHGTLLKNNAPVLSFISQHAGMGDFTFVPEKSADYRVRLQENDTVAQPGRLADSLESYILPVKKAGYKPAPLTLMLFNYNKKNMRVTVTDSSGKFYITPDDLAIGSRFFIKYLSEKEYSIQVSDPFRVINSTVRQKRLLPALSLEQLKEWQTWDSWEQGSLISA